MPCPAGLNRVPTSIGLSPVTQTAEVETKKASIYVREGLAPVIKGMLNRRLPTAIRLTKLMPILDVGERRDHRPLNPNRLGLWSNSGMAIDARHFSDTPQPLQLAFLGMTPMG
jgi:hypothetical protein